MTKFAKHTTKYLRLKVGERVLTKFDGVIKAEWEWTFEGFDGNDKSTRVLRSVTNTENRVNLYRVDNNYWIDGHSGAIPVTIWTKAP